MNRKLDFKAVNQKGSVLVITLLVLAAISIIGVTSLNMSTTELKIVCNEREIKEVYYLSESAVMEGLQRLIATPAVDLNEKIQPWHHRKMTISEEKIDFRDPRFWDADGKGQDNSRRSALDSDSSFAAVESRLASGSSAIVTESRLYMNKVYGLTKKHEALNIVEVGYYLRY